MEIENIFIMKQPALGKRISELRKQKGLTQEELVEKCNVSVRTIQRIESGEVTPRSFTIKTILAALDEKLETITLDNVVEISKKQLTILQAAWIVGVIYFIIGFVEVIADYNLMIGETDFISKPIYVVVKIITALSFSILFIGFAEIGKVFNKRFITISSYLFIVIFILSCLYDVFDTNYSYEITSVSLVLKSIVFGVLQVLFGISLLSLQKQFIGVVITLAVLEILTGVFFTTVVGAPVAMFFLIPTILLEIIVVFMVYQKFKKELYS